MVSSCLIPWVPWDPESPADWSWSPAANLCLEKPATERWGSGPWVSMVMGEGFQDGRNLRNSWNFHRFFLPACALRFTSVLKDDCFSFNVFSRFQWIEWNSLFWLYPSQEVAKMTELFSKWSISDLSSLGGRHLKTHALSWRSKLWKWFVSMGRTVLRELRGVQIPSVEQGLLKISGFKLMVENLTKSVLRFLA